MHDIEAWKCTAKAGVLIGCNYLSDDSTIFAVSVAQHRSKPGRKKSKLARLLKLDRSISIRGERAVMSEGCSRFRTHAMHCMTRTVPGCQIVVQREDYSI